MNDLTCSSTTIEENFNSEQIQLYPNPANNQITISVDQGPLGNVFIYNQIGQIIAKFYSDSATKMFDISRFENGLFFLYFPDKGITLKFTKAN